MKKLLLAVSLAAISTSALAQVSISGSVEAGIRSSVADVISVGGSKSDRNQITFAAREDLGRGLSANFILQNRFDLSNGSASQVNSADSTKSTTFEQSAVGLTHNSLGSVRIGRFTNVLGANGLRYLVQEDSPYGAQDTTQYSRLSGQSEYTSPKVYGVTYTMTRADLGANKFITFVNGNGTTVTTDISGSGNDLTAHTLSFDQGPVFLAVSQVSGFAGEKSMRVAGAYSLTKDIRIAAGQFNQQDRWQTQLQHKNNYIGAEYKFGRMVTAVTYSKADAKAAANHIGQVEKLGAKAYYSLSQRTTLIAEVGDTKNASAALNGTAYIVGVRHTF